MTHHFEARNYEFTPFPTVKNWIGGQWVEGTGNETFEVVNPRHGQVMATARSSTAHDVAAAVNAAKVNLKEWQSKPIRENGGAEVGCFGCQVSWCPTRVQHV